MLIDGRKIAGGIIAGLKTKPRPGKYLAVIQVGDEPTMVSFIAKKEKIAHEIGVDFRISRSPESISGEELRQEISKIAGDPECGGIVLQLPLPGHIDRDETINLIPPEKDIDNLTGKSPVLPPAVGVVATIIKNCKLEIENLSVAVVGLGFLIGKPVSAWLKGKCPEIHLLDSGNDLKILKQVDLVVSGVGKAGLIKPDMLKDGAILIDFGYSLKRMANDKEQMAGDFEPPSGNLPFAIYYTPTPGGTGPALVAALFENFYKLNSL